MSTKKTQKSESTEIINRIKLYLSLKRDHEVAELFGITPNDLSNRKKRGTVKKIAVEWASKENINLGWLIQGQGYPKDKNNELDLKQPNREYDKGGGWEPRNLDKLTDDPAMSRAMVLLAKIYDTKDSKAIRHAYNLLKSTYENFGEKNEEKQG